MSRKKLKFLAVLVIIIGMLPFEVLGALKIPEATKNFYVNDYAKVIDKETELEMAEQGKRLDEKFGAQVVLVTVNSTKEISIDDYASQLFNQWGIGDKEKNNGLLILFSVKDDNYWVLQGKGLEQTLTNDKISDTLWEYLEPDFAKKDYNAGAKKIYNVFFKKVAAISKAQVKAVQENNSDNEITKEQEGKSQEEVKSFVYDNANILSQKAEDYISMKSEESKKKYNASFYVVTKAVSDADSFREDAIEVFEEIKADENDILLVMYEEDDNYWILPGAVVQDYATETVLNRIINNFLEPEFSRHKYSEGATATGDEFYKLFQRSFKTAENTLEGTPAVDMDNKTTTTDSPSDTEEYDRISMISFLLFMLILAALISSSRKKRYIRVYGVPFNPYSRKRVRLYGPNGYWGHYGPPPAGGGYWYGGSWHTNPRQRNNTAYRNQQSSGSYDSSWGSGGSSSSGGGAGRQTRSSSSESRSFGSSSWGGGSSSSNGGSGRSSSSSSNNSSRSGSSSSSGGGGRASSGGGAGRSSGGGAGRGGR